MRDKRQTREDRALSQWAPGRLSEQIEDIEDIEEIEKIEDVPNTSPICPQNVIKIIIERVNGLSDDSKSCCGSKVVYS